MKGIIHQKILPGTTLEQAYDLHNVVRNILSDYTVITTPTEINSIEGDVKIIKIDAKEYSYNELQEIIEKAWQYDDLCG